MKSIISLRIKSRKKEADNLKATICRLLHWTELQYADFQFETGIAYLQYYIPRDQYGIDMLIREKIFWNWWKNHWNQRDQGFAIAVQAASLNKRIEIYENMHDPRRLASAIYPNGVVLTNTYARMINELQDQHLK